MKTIVEFALNATMVALWAAAILATAESTARLTRGAVARTAVMATVPAVSAPAGRR